MFQKAIFSKAKTGVVFHFAETSRDIAVNERFSFQNRGDLYDKKKSERFVH